MTNKIEFTHTKQTLKKLRLLFFIIAILCFVNVALIIYKYNKSQINLDHIFVCDNPNHDSDFDKWIKEDLNVTWVPSYIIIQDGYVIGAFDGNISEAEFSDKLAMASSYNMQFYEVPDYEIENLDNNRISASSIFKDGLYILEIVWIDCDDCKYQDEHYTDDIYAKYSTTNIYRYYIKSDHKKVLEKYK